MGLPALVQAWHEFAASKLQNVVLRCLYDFSSNFLCLNIRILWSKSAEMLGNRVTLAQIFVGLVVGYVRIAFKNPTRVVSC